MHQVCFINKTEMTTLFFHVINVQMTISGNYFISCFALYFEGGECFPSGCLNMYGDDFSSGLFFD